MVVEHIFVTTLDAPNAMHEASGYLTERGFAQPPQGAFLVGADEWTALELNRGKKKAAKAKNVRELPQTVRMEWDRGRVTVALSIGFNAAWGGGGFGATSEKSSKMVLHTKLLFAIAVGLQRLLAYDGNGQRDYAQWDAVEAEILAAARKRRIRAIIIVCVLLAIVFGIIMLAVIGAASK